MGICTTASSFTLFIFVNVQVAGDEWCVVSTRNVITLVLTVG